jgi:hypothetical protein
MVLGQPSQLGEPLQAVVPLYGVIAAMPGIDLIRDVPEKLDTHQQTLQADDSQITVIHLIYYT